MCRLFGFRSNVPSQAHRSLLEAENAIASQARYHADGWGIGWFLGQDPYVLKAESGAAGDERFARITKRLTSHTFVVHVRRATVGVVDQLNSHPFRHGRWMLAHNGTIFGFDAVRDRVLDATLPELRPLIFGNTDSEHLFFYLLSALHGVGQCHLGHAEIDVSVAAVALRDAVDRIYGWCETAGLEPPILNFILTNGAALFAQRAGLELFLATQKVSCRDYDSCTADKICFAALRPLPKQAPDGPVRRCNHLLVASERIGAEDIWEEVPQGHLLALDEDLQLSLFAPAPRFRPNPAWPRPREETEAGGACPA
ncbi:MAG: class II glutamine amidotransferase [Alphaproteobacteria bacterium]|nr:class II glutamine amidotransferase [Alphaproteobacteria bacterium]